MICGRRSQTRKFRRIKQKLLFDCRNSHQCSIARIQKERGPGFHQGLRVTTRAMPGIRTRRICSSAAASLFRERERAQRRGTEQMRDRRVGANCRHGFLRAPTESASVVAYAWNTCKLSKPPPQTADSRDQAGRAREPVAARARNTPSVTAPPRPFRRCGCESPAQGRKQRSCHHLSDPSWPRL